MPDTNMPASFLISPQIIFPVERMSCHALLHRPWMRSIKTLNTPMIKAISILMSVAHKLNHQPASFQILDQCDSIQLATIVSHVKTLTRAIGIDSRKRTKSANAFGCFATSSAICAMAPASEDMPAVIEGVIAVSMAANALDISMIDCLTVGCMNALTSVPMNTWSGPAIILSARWNTGVRTEMSLLASAMIVRSTGIIG